MQGLKETRHPYTFVASEGLKQMLMIEDAEERTIPLLPKLIPPLRQALVRRFCYCVNKILSQIFIAYLSEQYTRQVKWEAL